MLGHRDRLIPPPPTMSRLSTPLSRFPTRASSRARLDAVLHNGTFSGRRSKMFLPFPAMLVAAPFVIGVADPVPKFNLDAGCAAHGMRGSDDCLKSETAAREYRAKPRSQVPTAARHSAGSPGTSAKVA